MKGIKYAILAAFASTVHGFKTPHTVKTTSGPVEGHDASEETSVQAYLGIPYALPPTGSRRFQPPEAYSGSSVINGSSIVSN
jgi:hypothetical protein